MRERPSAPLLVVDPWNRILLFRFRFDSGPLTGTAYWATPGGALDVGETYAQAARRELMEETGIDAEVGDAVAIRQTSFMLSTGEMVSAEEHYFLVQTDHAVDIGGNPDPVERAFIAEAKWWADDELSATADAVFPENIADMVRHALAHPI
jgi:8-oxo-dGTP diphosphatase